MYPKIESDGIQQQILHNSSNPNLCMQIDVVSRNSPNSIQQQNSHQSQRIGQKGPGAPKGSKQHKKNSVGEFVGFFF